MYYEQSGMGLKSYSYPDFTLPLGIAGIVLLVTGNILEQRVKGEKESVKEQEPIADLGFCPRCGALLNSSAQQCEKCGEKLRII